MINKQVSLQNELQAAGASGSEARDLALLANQFSSLKKTTGAKVRHRRLPIFAVPVAALASVIILVTAAQSSLPGSWLYSVKKASESGVALVDPGFKGNIMVRRSAEVKQLVANHADTKRVVATLAAYRREAAGYQSADYSVFENCKHNLRQAAKAAPADQRSAITATIAAIPHV